MKGEWPPVMFIVRATLFGILTLLSSADLNNNRGATTTGARNYDDADTTVDRSDVVRCSPDDGCYEYVTFRRGSATGWPPVVLSAPHAGHLSPSTIPDREAGCWDRATSQCVWSHDCGVKNFTACTATTDDDYATHELATQIHHQLCTIFDGHCPALVLNNLARVKFDANRAKPEATFGVPSVETAFDKYNENIESAKQNIIRRHGAGLFIDIHGHGHKLQRAELGYLLRGAVLDSGKRLNDSSATSIRGLADRFKTYDFDDLLRGDSSFGAFMETFGYQAVPSPGNRGPGSGNIYFNGGYLTRRYGSSNGGSFDAIQIESARSSREPGAIGRYAEALAHTIRRYVCHYYTSSKHEVVSTDAEVLTTGCLAMEDVISSSGEQVRAARTTSVFVVLVAAHACVGQLGLQ